MVGHYFWDNQEGGVNICKQLGYAQGGRRYTAGKGSQLPQLETWRICYGGERTFFDCPERAHNGHYRGPDHSKDQGVSCEGTRRPRNPRQDAVCARFQNLAGCPNGTSPEYMSNQIDFDRHYYEAVRSRQGGADGRYLPVIIQRECSDCADSHKNIFYKRLNPVNRYFDAYHMFITSWRTSYQHDAMGGYAISNEFNKDFELYSTLEDALAGENRWTYCNFNDWVGFPRDCGPTRKTNNQWNGILDGQVRGRVNYQYSYFKPIKCPAGTYQNEDGLSCSVEKCKDGERMEYPKLQPGVECENCKTDIDGRPYRCQACPKGLTVPDPSDPTECVIHLLLKQVTCKRGHRVDQLSFETYGGERKLSHQGLAGGAWRKDQVLNLDSGEHIKRVEAYHIDGGYLNDELAKIVYVTSKDKIVSCFYDRARYKTTKQVFEAGEGKQIMMVNQY